VCEAPIEIVNGGGPRLACADDPDVASCGPLRAGDRVTSPGCEVAAMSAPARLLTGLPLDLNRASRADLLMLDGIGPKKAAAIIAEREAGGAFGSVAELARVRGIGRATVEKLAPFLTVGEPR
jgi:competence ComEA-like helix-hairpin-helix protein